MDRKLVVARYFKYSAQEGKYTDIAEDIGWLSRLNIETAFVYDHWDGKLRAYHSPEFFLPLSLDDKENVGREQGAYLDFIYYNYEHICEMNGILIFSQADPFYHNHNFVEDVNNTSDEYMVAHGYKGLSENYVRPSYLSGVKYELKRCFGIDNMPDEITVTGNGLFMAHTGRIKHYPREAWDKIRQTMSVTNLSLEVYTGEIMWKYLLGDHFDNCNCNTV